MVPLNSPPPGIQSQHERWSLVYFTRPGDSAILRPLSEQSAMIAEAAKKNADKGYETGSTSLEWFSRRVRNQRMKNRTVSFCELFGVFLGLNGCRALKRGERVGELNMTRL